MKDFLKKKTVAIRVSEEDHKLITRKATEEKMHRGSYLREIILKFINGDNNNGK